jgi:uncharacterized protein (TIGR02391 family)
VRRLTFENLHSTVQSAAGELFADGHYETSVSEAFKSIEVRIRELTGLNKSGAALMGDAFRADGSALDVAGHEGRTGDDEREDRTVPYNKPDVRPRCDQPGCVDC